MRNKLNAISTNVNSKLAKTERRHRWKLLATSLAFLTLAAFFWYTPATVDRIAEEADARAFAHAVMTGYHQAIAEEQRVAEENEIMKQYDCLALTLYWEAERYNDADNQAIADVVFSRVVSGNYPDTICEVTNEVRRNSDGDNVAMFSYIYDIIGKPAPSGAAWTYARRQAAIGYARFLDGFTSTGVEHYLADYAHPRWRTQDVAECKKEIVPIKGAFHIFFRTIPAAQRPACLASRKAEMVASVQEKTPALPKKGPVPSRRPVKAQDEVASLILKN